MVKNLSTTKGVPALVPSLTISSINSTLILCIPLLRSLRTQKLSAHSVLLKWNSFCPTLPNQSPAPRSSQLFLHGPQKKKHFAMSIHGFGASTLPCLIHLEYLNSVSQDSKLAIPFTSFISSGSAAVIHQCTPVSLNILAIIAGSAASIAVLTSRLAKSAVLFLWASCITASFLFSSHSECFCNKFVTSTWKCLQRTSRCSSHVRPPPALWFFCVVQKQHNDRRVPHHCHRHDEYSVRPKSLASERTQTEQSSTKPEHRTLHGT